MSVDNEKLNQLRNLAEYQLKNTDTEQDTLPVSDVHDLLHELYVHQIELELQNEELLASQYSLVDSQARYKALYDFAPLAYFTVDSHNKIYRSNATAVETFEVDSADFKQTPFTDLIALEDRDTFHIYFNKLIRTQKRQVIELTCLRKSGKHFYARMESIPQYTHSNSTSKRFNIVVSDISQQKTYQMRLQGLHTLDQSILRSQSVEEIIEVALQYLYTLVKNAKLRIFIFTNTDKAHVYTRSAETEGVEVEIQTIPAQFRVAFKHDEYHLVQSPHFEPSPVTYLLVPVFETDMQHGLIVTEVSDKEQLDQDVISVIQETSVQIGIAIQKANLYQQLVNQARDLEARVEDRTHKLAEREQSEYAQRVFAEALLDISRSLNSTLDVEQVLEGILVNIKRVVSYDRVSIMLVEVGGGTIMKWSGEYSEGFEQTIKTNLEQLEKNEFGQFIKDGAYSFVKLPIRSGEVTHGILSVDRFEPHQFSEEEIGRLEAFAELASIALNNANLHQQAQSLAVLEERQRLARDLHDAVSQTLFSLRVTSEALQKKPDHKQLDKYLNDMGRLARSAQAEMRLLMVELHPMILQDTTIEELIEKLVLGFRGRTKREIVLEMGHIPALTAKEKNAFFRIAQELLNNILKYAPEAKYVSVQLNVIDGHTVLLIEDDGQGFNVQENTKYGHGLTIMKERADEINAHFIVESELTVGTKVQLSLPIEVIGDEPSVSSSAKP